MVCVVCVVSVVSVLVLFCLFVRLLKRSEASAIKRSPSVSRRFFGVCFLLGDKLRSSTAAREPDSSDSPAHCVNSICVESATSWCLEGSEVSERTSGVGNSRVSGTGSCTSSSATCESELATEENAPPGPRVNTTTSDSGQGVPEEGSEGTRTVSGSLTLAEETSSLLATSKL